MLNHVRTLLLNENAVDAAGVDGVFPVDPSFHRISLGGSLQELHMLFMQGASGIAGRATVVDCAYALVRRMDLSGRLAVFDSRETPFRGVTGTRTFGALMARRAKLLGRTGFEDLDSNIRALESLVYSVEDGPMAEACLIVALACAMEAARRRRGG